MNTENHDIRWKQRFSNYKRALTQLLNGVELANTKDLNDLEKQGLIQSFEFTHEMAWKTLKDFIESRGSEKMYGSRDATREAFKLDLITDGETWMEMIESRNLSSHTYDETIAKKILDRVCNSYHTAFSQLNNELSSKE